MAKMFYTMDETKGALGKNEEEIKQLSREGRLREFRDGARLMFKADQVEQIKAELGGGDSISLAPAHESGAPIGMSGDSKSGSAIGLVDSGAGTQFPDLDIGGSPKMPGDSRAGSGSGLGNLTGAGGSGSGLSNLGSGAGSGSHGSRAGVNIFEVDESQKVDPSAQTAINASVQEQVSLDNVGSGSGLLDLTRESDDTSLGAVFDELGPTSGAAPARRASASPSSASAMETQAGADIGMAAAAPRVGVAPIYVEQSDAFSVGLGTAALAGAIIVCFGAFILAAGLAGYRPDILNSLRAEASGKLYLLGGFGAVVLFGIIGFFVGKK